MTSSLIPDPDPTRTPWCLLSLELASTTDSTTGIRHITGWQLGDANSSQLVNLITHTTEGSEAENTAVKKLSNELQTRQHQDVLLITQSDTDLSILRTHLAQTHLTAESASKQQITTPVERPSLHGFRHLALDQIITEYFVDGNWLSTKTESISDDEFGEADGDNLPPESMWRLTRSLLPLIPIEAAHGEAI